MNKLLQLLLLTTLALPCAAQPGERGPGDRPDLDGPPHHRDQQRPGDREDQDRDKSRRGETLPVEMIDQAIATLRELHPDTKLDWIDRIEKLAEEKPEEAARMLSRFPRIREMMDARQNRPDEFALHSRQSTLMRETFGLVREYHDAKANDDQAKMDEVEPQIRERFEELFQIRLKMKEIEIQRMREQLKDAEEELKKIEADSEALIDQKMKEMMERSPRGPRDDDEEDRPDSDRRPDRKRPDKPAEPEADAE